MIKLLNYCNAEYKIVKKLFIVYKQYKYLGETFYCVKIPRSQKSYDFQRYAFLEKRSGRFVIYHIKNEILSEKQFKKEIRRLLTLSAKRGGKESLHKLIEWRIGETK